MDLRKIAVIGGTGALGAGLAGRLQRAGHEVVIGSRDAAKAAAAAQMMTAADGGSVRGMANADAARAADLIIVTVPFASQRATLEEILPALDGKIVVDATVALCPPKVGTVQLPAEGSAGMIAGQIIGDRARLVSAFQNISASELSSRDPIQGDVLVTGNDRAACDDVIALCGSIKVRGLYAGPLANSAATEALTSVLITLNRQYKCHASILITDIP